MLCAAPHQDCSLTSSRKEEDMVNGARIFDTRPVHVPATGRHLTPPLGTLPQVEQGVAADRSQSSRKHLGSPRDTSKDGMGLAGAYRQRLQLFLQVITSRGLPKWLRLEVVTFGSFCDFACLDDATSRGTPVFIPRCSVIRAYDGLLFLSTHTPAPGRLRVCISCGTFSRLAFDTVRRKP